MSGLLRPVTSDRQAARHRLQERAPHFMRQASAFESPLEVEGRPEFGAEQPNACTSGSPVSRRASGRSSEVSPRTVVVLSRSRRGVQAHRHG